MTHHHQQQQQQAINCLSDQLAVVEPNWNAVRYALQTNPRAVFYVLCEDGSTVLHSVCYKNAPLSVVQLLVRQHPQLVTETDHGGNLPLHDACRKSHSLEVIELLVQQQPDTVKEKNAEGDLPLHLACEHKQSVEVIQWLVQQYPEAVKEKTSEGDLPLHLAIRFNHSLEAIQCLVEQHPNALKIMNKKNGDLPLHYACACNQSLEVIQWLVQQYPNATTAKNNLGYIPLHIGCSSKQSLELIALLVQQHPDTIKEKTKMDDLPLHKACENKQSLEVIQLLVQQHPDSVRERNCVGSLPLHRACAGQQTIEVIQWLVQQYPNAIKEKDKNGWIPLHLACACKASLEVIQFLVQQHPNHINEGGCYGLRGATPLALARRPANNQSPDPRTVQWLEAVASGQIKLTKLPLALPKLSPQLGEKKPNRPSAPPTTAMHQKVAKLPAAVAQDDAVTTDRRSVLAVLVGNNEIAAVSPSYIESIRTEETIANGIFGTVFKGTDISLKRSFAIKTIHTDMLWGVHSADVQTAKEAFLTEMKAFSLFCHPNIESVYAYTFADHVRPCCYLVCELAEKGSLDNFWKSDLGPERLSLFCHRIQIALDVMTAIQFLHSGNDQISSNFHCEIKSSSIVLKRDFTAQLIDCGLAKFVADAYESQSKSSTAYLCPNKGSSGVSFDRGRDIFSFGVLMVELLTGKLQNCKDKYGTSSNFELFHVNDKNDMAREINKDLDPALGYDTLALPQYVQDFADLAICCMQPKPNDWRAGEAVMGKLWAIWSQCCSRISVVDSLPGTLELTVQSKDKCKVCRTFPSVSSQSVCVVCKSAEERRAQLSFRGESRRHVGATKAKLESSSLPFLSRFDMRLNNPVPRLFVIVPLCIKSVMCDPKAWLRSRHTTRYCLYFVCVHSMTAIAPPVPIIVTKCWLEKIAPALAMSLQLLQLGLEPEGCVELCFGEAKVTLRLNNTMIEKLLEAVSEISAETGGSYFLARLRSNKELDAEDIVLLNGDAYELVVEAAGEERGWRDRMEPVRKDGSPQIFWVAKEVANDTSNGYEIVQV